MERRLFILAAVIAGSLVNAQAKAAETNEVDRVRRFLEDRVQRDPDDITAQNRLADIYLQRLRETGDFEWLRRAG